VHKGYWKKTEFAENSKRETPEVHSSAVKVDREAARSLSIAMEEKLVLE
jgi:hypothetical protein